MVFSHSFSFLFFFFILMHFVIILFLFMNQVFENVTFSFHFFLFVFFFFNSSDFLFRFDNKLHNTIIIIEAKCELFLFFIHFMLYVCWVFLFFVGFYFEVYNLNCFVSVLVVQILLCLGVTMSFLPSWRPQFVFLL